MLPSASALACRRKERIQKAFSVDHHGPGSRPCQPCVLWHFPAGGQRQCACEVLRSLTVTNRIVRALLTPRVLLDERCRQLQGCTRGRDASPARWLRLRRARDSSLRRHWIRRRITCVWWRSAGRGIHGVTGCHGAWAKIKAYTWQGQYAASGRHAARHTITTRQDSPRSPNRGATQFEQVLGAAEAALRVSRVAW